MQLVLSWPVRVLVIAILMFALFIDGAGYIYRIANHYPLTGSVPGLPPNFGGWQIYIHKGLDLSGGTHIDYQLTNFPPGQSRSTVQQETIAVIQKRVNALGGQRARGAWCRHQQRSDHRRPRRRHRRAGAEDDRRHHQARLHEMGT